MERVGFTFSLSLETGAGLLYLSYLSQLEVCTRGTVAAKRFYRNRVKTVALDDIGTGQLERQISDLNNFIVWAVGDRDVTTKFTLGRQSTAISRFGAHQWRLQLGAANFPPKLLINHDEKRKRCRVTVEEFCQQSRPKKLPPLLHSMCFDDHHVAAGQRLSSTLHGGRIYHSWRTCAAFSCNPM